MIINDLILITISFLFGYVVGYVIGKEHKEFMNAG